MSVVVVHRGSRDAYQVALALSEAGLLDTLVTDIYWPTRQRWASFIEHLMPTHYRKALRRRNQSKLPDSRIRQALFSGLYSLVVSKLPFVPFTWQRHAVRWNDACLGRRAGRLATCHGSALLSYSYYAYWAFSSCSMDRPRILFQLHPHPSTVREILSHELILHPECADSLLKEWELALPEEDFRRLVAEASMAEYWIVASSFTRQTLIDQGLPRDRIYLAPYGVDLRRFSPPPLPSSRDTQCKTPLRLLFVGTINQRKGIKYLLEALRLLSTKHVELTVCGRVVDDLTIFRPFLSQVRIRPSVTQEELVEAYQSADVFVFPSLAEGFGAVLLEAMACGLPIVSTTNTAAPDIITNGEEGFVIEPGRADMLAEYIGWFLEHPDKLTQMSQAARHKAEQFTWSQFRSRLTSIIHDILQLTHNNRDE